MKSITYACAAVSDFFVENPVEHKIQSGGKLDLSLQPTPKKLGKIKEWNPSTFLVSFKLETDTSILEKKAKDSMKNYGVDAVVANELKSRRTHVTVYHAKADKVENIQLLDPDYDDMISEHIVDHLLFETMNIDRYVPDEPESKNEKDNTLEEPKKKRERGGRRERERKERIARKEEAKAERETPKDDDADYRRGGHDKDIPKGYDRSLELFVSNIVPVKDNMTYAREEDPELHNLFSAYGEVVKMKFIRSTFGLATIKAYVEYDNEASASKAVKKLDGFSFRGELLSVQF